ncbi:MAG: PepSY domain-containing protein [Gammaproteobacteria bacterium]|jgi:uncharacterized membrane protein YkoI|nr:hypothetical protein [Chromatiales bacterium]MDP7153370.1 PepSY domain-containing protein [Gammaproteobacteria bacterium]MDP7297578.1 PepSY domain-containing protein [Gammaproteobacteria bacterium]MDP7419548.1 PepSY domain-containing protein [Gammaproteobacteria bacterium]MDP7659591.1 PepSY domain-containing protein [Gammaproteobacteria bacterium]
MNKFRFYLCLSVVCGVMWLTTPNPAFSRDRERYTLDQAVALVKNSFGGQVLKAILTEQDGRQVYRIRVLTEDGRVRTFSVDAQDGLVE